METKLMKQSKLISLMKWLITIEILTDEVLVLSLHFTKSLMDKDLNF
jgi:hypothetical protein